MAAKAPKKTPLPEASPEQQPAEALPFEVAGLCCRILVVDGGLRHVAKLEAHAAAILQVDGGKEDHGRHLRKLAMRRRPSSWLFSGWNCVPTRFS